MTEATAAETSATTSPQPVITAVPTITDGLVVRWYSSVHAAELRAETVSASRHGVMAGPSQYITGIPPAWLDAAVEAYKLLATGSAAGEARVRGMATHKQAVADGRFVPIACEDQGTEAGGSAPGLGAARSPLPSPASACLRGGVEM